MSITVNPACSIRKAQSPFPQDRAAILWYNLLINAKDALADRGGRIRIRTGSDGADVSVEIEDSGRGIPAADLPRIFDPGFTTKGVGVGTGLGLAICYQIVQEHGGSIEATSELDVGTTVTVCLNRNAQPGGELPRQTQNQP